MMTPSILQQTLLRVERLGLISESASGLARTFLSPAHHAAAETLQSWMEELGLATAHDAVGNVRGILPGSDPLAKPLLIGSHYDTVIDAGKYDGALGILAALAALEALRQDGTTLPFPVHLLAFAEEEGVRFQSTYLGSRSLLGPLEPWLLARRDARGVSLAEAIAAEGWHAGAEVFHYDASACSGYLELHIEQGRVLEEAGEPAGIVSSICAQTRLRVTLTGHADHAGTTPMGLRRDALAGAAECILAVETLARNHEPLVATVGQLHVHPGACNAVPQNAEFSIDARHPSQDRLAAHLAVLHDALLAVSSARGLDLTWEIVQENGSVTCDAVLQEELLDSLEAVTGSRLLLPSGAGHDGVILSRAMPIGMVFLRCRDGLSHHPEEYASPEDIETGIRILIDFLQRWQRS